MLIVLCVACRSIPEPFPEDDFGSIKTGRIKKLACDERGATCPTSVDSKASDSSDFQRLCIVDIR